MSINVPYHKKVKRVRTQLRCSQQKFAALIGVSHSTVRNWEQPSRGKPRPATCALIDLFYADSQAAMQLLQKTRSVSEAGERMTKNQYQAMLKIIRVFLLTRGWSAERVQNNVEDGHWILWWIKTYWDPTCPSCYQPYIENLLPRMENGSYLRGSPLSPGVEHPWTPECSKHVQEKASLTSLT